MLEWVGVVCGGVALRGGVVLLGGGGRWLVGGGGGGVGGVGGFGFGGGGGPTDVLLDRFAFCSAWTVGLVGVVVRVLLLVTWSL